MPHLSRWFAHTAFIYLVVGFTIGGLILSAKAGFVDAHVWVWLLLHVDILVMGWLVQLAMSMSFWILPRIRNAGRGHVALAWVSYFLLNGGLILGAGVSLAVYWYPGTWVQLTFTAGLLVQTVAVCLYVIYAWPRILPTITAAEVKRKTENTEH
jgi:hypothetical protein